MSFISEKKVKSMMEQSHVAGLSMTYMKGKPCGVHETYSWGVSNILKKEGKKIIGLSVVVELLELKGRTKVNMEVDSIVKY